MNYSGRIAHIDCKELANPNKRYISSVIHAIAIYNSLSKSEQNLIPDSLINALCEFSGVENATDIKPAQSLEPMSDLTSGIMALFLLYGGINSKSESISHLKEVCDAKERQVIKEILVVKKSKYEND